MLFYFDHPVSADSLFVLSFWLKSCHSFTNNFISSMPLENTFLAILHDLCQIWLDTRCKQQWSCLLLSEWPLLDCIDCASFRHRYLSRTNSGIHMWHPSSEMGVESLEESIALCQVPNFGSLVALIQAFAMRWSSSLSNLVPLNPLAILPLSSLALMPGTLGGILTLLMTAEWIVVDCCMTLFMPSCNHGHHWSHIHHIWTVVELQHNISFACGIFPHIHH